MATDLRAEGAKEQELAAELAGLDALEAHIGTGPSRLRRAWSAVWPKLAAYPR